MDIELLAKMVKELVLDNESVALPGLGAFVAEMVPASFSDRGYTINPPYRRLTFRALSRQVSGPGAAAAVDDGLLAAFYAANNNVEKEMAGRIIASYVAELAQVLKTSKVVVLPELGRLRTGRDGNIFFIPDEDLDIYPDGLGLDPISLKSHSKPKSFDFSTLEAEIPQAPQKEESPAEEPAAEEEIPAEKPTEEEIPAEEPAEEVPAEEPVEEEIPVEEPAVEEAPAEEPVARQETEDDFWKKEDYYDDDEDEYYTPVWRKLLIALIIILAVAALLLVAFLFVAHHYPDLIDKILYTKEELELLEYLK